MPSNPTARERAAEWFFDLGISLTPQRIDAFLDAERAAREDEREQCAKIAEGGSFLHDDAPDARFGKACAAAIRARKETP